MSLSQTFVFVLILGIMVSPLSAGDVEDLKATFDKALTTIGRSFRNTAETFRNVGGTSGAEQLDP